MSFLDIKDPAERATLVKESVKAMKTVKQRNMVNREMKLEIVDELQTLFHPIVNATKQAAEEPGKQLALMKKTLTDIDGALTAQRATDVRPRPENIRILPRQHGCFKSHIAAIKRFFIFVWRSGTSLASKCKHGSSLDISFLSVTRIL